MGAVASTVAARFAFFPPTPPSYGVEPPPSPAAAAADSEVVELSGVAVPRGRGVEARRLPTKRGTEVVAMYVRQPGARLTLLYSHGNAADLGQMYELFVELSTHLNVNLMGYVPPRLAALYCEHWMLLVEILPVVGSSFSLLSCVVSIRSLDWVERNASF